MSAADPKLLERLRRRLRKGDTITEAARACGVSDDVGRGMIRRHGRGEIAPPPPPLATEPEVPGPRDGCCAWPEGEGRAIRFECSAPPLLGRPYCDAHCRRAFQHAPPRSDRPFAFARLVSTL